MATVETEENIPKRWPPLGLINRKNTTANAIHTGIFKEELVGWSGKDEKTSTALTHASLKMLAYIVFAIVFLFPIS